MPPPRIPPLLVVAVLCGLGVTALAGAAAPAGAAAAGEPAVRPVVAGPAVAAGVGGWPVRPAIVRRGFRPPVRDWLPGHRGVDLQARPGQPVHSPAAGVVVFAAMLAGRGVLVVRHGALRSSYEPVAATVAVGARVSRGEVIGYLATGTGHCGGASPCLHWGLRRGEVYLDPRLLLTRPRPVLRPPRWR